MFHVYPTNAPPYFEGKRKNKGVPYRRVHIELTHLAIY
jgi:hypothetical protein